MSFDGPTYSPELDLARLSTQLAGVLQLMLDGEWRTPAEIAQHVQGSESGITARLRDLRKERFGGYTVARRRRTAATWEYAVTQPGRVF